MRLSLSEYRLWSLGRGDYSDDEGKLLDSLKISLE